MTSSSHDSIRAVVWRDGALLLLDQRRLPQKKEYCRYSGAAEVAAAIRDMVVRGAPAIGITAAYGVVLAARARYARSPTGWREAIEQDLASLAGARPTAVNLFWALDRMREVIATVDGDPEPRLLAAARRLHDDDIAANRKMGDLGAKLITGPCAVLTHCNAGALATGGYGTALGVIRSAYAAGKIQRVYANETRPWLQGARLTAWEMVEEGIPVTLEVEGAAAALMKQGKVRWVVVGSDRIAANGDVANKIGTYGLAVLARHHGVKFMVAAPTSTVDMDMANGDAITIEQRDAREVLGVHGHPVAAPGAQAWNPSFDVTPAELVDAIVTEKGVVMRPNREKVARMMAGG
ncbi:MAG TPA: S-methyl-5-thioribose-1-phosphate isomerase [Gammaproteobacteria bacterium]|nr:S-methyl-5-thioribose-1-phosphate isomerase [Gammaproteobacteria bacterium]